MRSCTRRRTRFACRLTLVLALAAAPLQAQAPQQDEAVVTLLARLLALSDARQFDDALLRQALQSDNFNVRFQAVLAAGRIGDPQAVELLVPVLRDSSGAVQTAAAFALGVLGDARAVEPLLGIVRSIAPAAQGSREMEAVTALAKIGGEEGAQAIRVVLESAPLGQSVPPIVLSGLLEAWRLGARAPPQQLDN